MLGVRKGWFGPVRTESSVLTELLISRCELVTLISNQVEDWAKIEVATVLNFYSSCILPAQALIIGPRKRSTSINERIPSTSRAYQLILNYKESSFTPR